MGQPSAIRHLANPRVLLSIALGLVLILAVSTFAAKPKAHKGQRGKHSLTLKKKAAKKAKKKKKYCQKKKNRQKKVCKKNKNESQIEAIPRLFSINDIAIRRSSAGYGSARGGFYQLPHDTRYWNSVSSAREQRGSRCLVGSVAAVAKTWKLLHPEDRVHVKDLNAPGHLSHRLGVDVDIYTDRAGNMTRGTYTKERSIEFGKLWLATRNIDVIFFNDGYVRAKVNGFANKRHLRGRMQHWPLHHDHFHVRLRSSGCSRK